MESFVPKPILDRKPTVPEVLPIAEAFYGLPGNGVGGCLHIVLDDANVADSHVKFCQEQALRECDQPAYFLTELLLLMSKSQRARLGDKIGVVESNSVTEQQFWIIAGASLSRP